uniref:PCI domain-containing protein n=1 Tax=Panagrolaimus sp. JU765 TaxID=591449 RepID=A0AC34QQ27_9BILA
MADVDYVSLATGLATRNSTPEEIRSFTDELLNLAASNCSGFSPIMADVDYVSLATGLATRNSTPEEIRSFTDELLNLAASNVSGAPVTIAVLRAVIAQENAGIVQKQLFNDVVDGLKPPLSPQVIKDVALGILTILSTRAIAYEDLIRKLKMLLASIYEQEHNYDEASTVLLGALSDTNLGRSQNSTEQASLLLHLVKICLQAGKLDDAEQVITRVSMKQHELEDQILAEYNYYYAIILDKRSKFIEAATRYHDLSVSPYIPAEERRQMLQKAVICVILSPESPVRQRLLPALFNEERCRKVVGFNILEKMYLNRLITPQDVVDFEAILEPHQRSQIGKESYLQQFTLEHNVVALSKIFKNISFAKMASLLNTDIGTVERTTARMITCGRLEGLLDQAKSVISFRRSQEKQGLEQHFLAACQEANNVFDKIVDTYPEWYSQNFTR